jgi:hypothetical protein
MLTSTRCLDESGRARTPFPRLYLKKREVQMNQSDLHDSPIPAKHNADTACRHEEATGLSASRSQTVGKKASSRIRPAVRIAAVFAGLIVVGCTSLPQASSNECVGPVSYCQLFFGS